MKLGDLGHYYIAQAFKRLEEPMQRFPPIFLLCLLSPAAIVLAQDKPADKPAAAPSPDNPLSAFNKRAYGQILGFFALLGRRHHRAARRCQS
jgi:hypothetical protein